MAGCSAVKNNKEYNSKYYFFKKNQMTTEAIEVNKALEEIRPF
jgi:hypothetical protein